jgi:hypothetical protein
MPRPLSHATVGRNLALLLLAAFGACASQSRSTTKLPFHVAIVPAVAFADTAARPAEGEPTALVLAFEAQDVMRGLDASLARMFTKVTRLAPSSTETPLNSKEWVVMAQEQGADLLLLPTLRYDPKVHTSLNDRFWLNLPLFALGGPFCWFVADRSYFCYSRLDGELFDVTVAAANQRQTLDTSSRVLRVERESTEASVNFLQRADGVGPYLLSVVCPAGLVWPESGAIPAELAKAVGSQLCEAMSKSMQDRATEITECDLVDFFPRDVRVQREGGHRVLTGQMVLELGEANELGRLRFRGDIRDEFQEAAWIQDPKVAADSAGVGRRAYSLRIPLDGIKGGTVQVEVEQLDRALTRRTFTFELATDAR